MAGQQNQQDNINYTGLGLNTDSVFTQVKPGMLTDAMNAVVEGTDGQAITYQNEQSNNPCATLPTGYQTIGVFNITQLTKVIYFLANPSTGYSQIGYSDNDQCVYNVLIDDSVQGSDKLNFNILYPIKKIVTKSTNCSTQFYWTDNYNGRRYVDLNNLPWKDQPNPSNSQFPIILTGQLDANKLLVQPNFAIPEILPLEVTIGGKLTMGTYQFSVQYANSKGEAYTSFYNVTNPIGIYETKESTSFDLTTGKAISVSIKNLDTTGLYSYFNLAVVKTINNIPSVELVGTFSITGPTYQYTYTGAEESSIRLTIEDIFEKYQYYDLASDVFEVDNVLGWDGLTSSDDTNFQEIWNGVHLQWETYKIPYNQFEGYTNGVNSSLYRGYMRDEVYSFEGCFILKNGMQTKSFHIPGRTKLGGDILPMVEQSNLDSESQIENPCTPSKQLERWQVYNTGTLIDYTDEYKSNTQGDCYVGSYQYGEMSYWESTDLYPNNPVIWGELAGKPIRHHKFPDSVVTHIHDNNVSGQQSFEHSIFPIGVRIDTASLYKAIKESDIDDSIKSQIAGFKITRGNRAGNKSVIAKGIFNNVGRYTYIPPDGVAGDAQTYYYPNYPYNDVRPDPFFTQTLIENHTGFRPDAQLQGFSSGDSKSRFVFYSPDTSFYNPSLNRGGQSIKVETIEYGESYGHFVSVDQNAKYLFLNKNGYNVAYGAGAAGTINADGSYTTPWAYAIGATLHPENFAPAFNGMLDILDKTLPYSNFGYSFNSYGLYNKYYPIPNDGNKIRAINYSKYLNGEYNSIENSNTINNYNRESSVYLNTNNNLLFPTEYDSSIPEDNSRYTISSFFNASDWDGFFNTFISNKSIVTSANISTVLTNPTYRGPQVYDFSYSQQLDVVWEGAVYNFITSTGVNLASFTFIDTSKYGNCPSTPIGTIGDYCGDILATLTSGNIVDVENALVLQASSSAGLGAGPTTFNYVNNPATLNYLQKVSGYSRLAPISYKAPAINRIDFKTFTEESYYSYLLTSPTAYNNAVQGAITKLSTVNTEADLAALNISTPSTIEDFISLLAYNAYLLAYKNWLATNASANAPETVRKSNINTYYGSIKSLLPNQWGQPYSYETIDTGFYSDLYQQDGTPFTKFNTVFGGDVFINRFALKTKMPIFEDNTVLDPDQTDIEYDKIANLTYPMFWFSTRPVDIASGIVDIVNGHAGKITTNLNPFNPIQLGYAGYEAVEMAIDILDEVLNNIGVRNLNLDNFKNQQLYEQGIMYLFAYGVPYFFVESEVNTEYRQATNNKEGDFYPHVSTDIPDEWVQEANVSIAFDNTYNYNQSYSKQNKEDAFAHLRPDYTPDNPCFTFYPNRVIWSDPSSLEETKNNWLVYKPGNVKDLTKSYGKLIGIDKTQGITLLARFENKSQLHNAQTQVNLTDASAPAYIGNPELFQAPPIDLSLDVISGYSGSQHTMLLQTPYGNVYADAKRGQVFLLQGTKITAISPRGQERWFIANLPFNITKTFPNADTDNSFNGIGLHGVYDSLYDRILITKLDYSPLSPNITYEDGSFWFDPCVSKDDTPGNGAYGNVICNLPKIKIELTDTKYFCNKSWSISYSFKSQCWVSYHSYQPAYYIPHPMYFQSATKGSNIIWNHNQLYNSFCNFYGIDCPYILEYPFVYKAEDQIITSVKDYCSAIQYSSPLISYEPDQIIYFNKAIISNPQQCSGTLNLIPKPKNNLAAYMQYPKYNIDSKDIIVTKADNYYQFNTFWDIVADKTKPFFNTTCTGTLDKVLDNTLLDYSTRSNKKYTIRGKQATIRLILDNRTDTKLVSKFIFAPTTTSFR